MEIRDRDFDREVLKSEKPVLVDFWGSWCIPCKKMESVIEKLKKDYPSLKFVSLNINRNPRTPRAYQVLGVPTYMLFKNGKIVSRDVGAKSENQLRKFIEDGRVFT